jgi:aminoglycoside phosphotransferase (APT) family kinase protein
MLTTSETTLPEEHPLQAASAAHGRRMSRSEERAALHSIGRQISQEIVKRAPGYLDAAASRVSVEEHGPLSVGYSVIFRFSLSATPGSKVHVFVKVPRAWKHGPFLPSELTGPTATRAQTEFALLSRTHEFFSARGSIIGVVRPYDYLGEYQAIVMERASGTPVQRHLSSTSQVGLRQVEWCGEWLRLFHREMHRPATMPWNADAFLEHIDRRLLPLRARGIPQLQLTRIREAISQTAVDIPGQTVEHSTLHGDFKLRHIFATENAIQVLDFGNSWFGDCQRDVAAFLVEVVVRSLWKPWWRQFCIQQYCEAFLRGYYGAAGPPLTLRLYVAEYMLKKWNRRLAVWADSVALKLLQYTLGACHIRRTLERGYLNRWFESRITAVGGRTSPADIRVTGD